MLGVGLQRGRTDVHDHLILRHLVDRDGPRPGARVDLRRDDRIGREHQAHPLATRLVDDPAGVLQLIGLDQALAEADALRGQERVRHATAEQHGLAARQERAQHLELAGDLGPADDRVEGARRLAQESGEGVHLALHEQPRHGGQEVGDALRRGVRAVGRAEGVVHVEVGEARERLRERRIVGLLGGVEAQVLEQQQVAGTQLVDRHLDARAERVARHPDRPSEELAQPLGDRAQAQRVDDLALRTAEVTGEDDRCAALEEVDDRRQAGANAGVVGDPPVLERHVQVGADEDPASGDIDVADGLGVHRRAAQSRSAMKAARSATRQE